MQIVQRDSHMTYRIEPLRRKTMRELSVGVAQPVPFVVAAIQPDRNGSARFQKARQDLKGFFAVGCMVKNTELGANGKEKTSAWKNVAER